MWIESISKRIIPKKICSHSHTCKSIIEEIASNNITACALPWWTRISDIRIVHNRSTKPRCSAKIICKTYLSRKQVCPICISLNNSRSSCPTHIEIYRSPVWKTELIKQTGSDANITGNCLALIGIIGEHLHITGVRICNKIIKAFRFIFSKHIVHIEKHIYMGIDKPYLLLNNIIAFTDSWICTYARNRINTELRHSHSLYTQSGSENRSNHLAARNFHWRSYPRIEAKSCARSKHSIQSCKKTHKRIVEEAIVHNIAFALFASSFSNKINIRTMILPPTVAERICSTQSVWSYHSSLFIGICIFTIR